VALSRAGRRCARRRLVRADRRWESPRAGGSAAWWGACTWRTRGTCRGWCGPAAPATRRARARRPDRTQEWSASPVAGEQW